MEWRKATWTALAALTLAGVWGSGCAAGRTEVPAVSPDGRWQLVWHDEFDGSGPIDGARWNFERGFCRNRESQYYTDDLKNCRRENGLLILEAHPSGLPNPHYDPKAPTDPIKLWRENRKHIFCTSAALESVPAFRYGRLEARARVSNARGTWPAFWMLGNNHRATPKTFWPQCGEIDIMEQVGYDPEGIHGTVHFASPATGKHQAVGGKTEARAWEGFHLYAVEWDEEKIVCFFDDRPYFTFRLDQAGTGADNPFRKPHFLILNLAVGGDWGGRKGIDTDRFPTRFEVDYVRVWEKRPDGRQ